MIAKTESGFEIELDDEAMNDVELVEAIVEMDTDGTKLFYVCLLYTSPSPRDTR